MLDLLAIAKKEALIHEFVIKNATLANKNFTFFDETDMNKLNVENPIPSEGDDFFQEPSANQSYINKYGSAGQDTKNVGYPWVSDPNFKASKEIIINLTDPYFAIREKRLIYNKCNSVTSLWIKNIVQDQDETKVYPDYEISGSFYIPESKSFGASRLRKSSNSMFPGALALFFYSMMKKKMKKELRAVEEIASACELSNFSKLYFCTKSHYKEIDAVLSDLETSLKKIKSATINLLLPLLFVFSGENLSFKLQLPKDAALDYAFQRTNQDKMQYRLNKANESYLDYISKYFISNNNLDTKFAYPRYVHLYKDGSTKCFYLAGRKPDGKAKFVDKTEYLALPEVDAKTKAAVASMDVNAAMKKHLDVLDRDEHVEYLHLKEVFPKFQNLIKNIVIESYKKELLIASL